ncbi:MAG: hypothetical protein IJ489_10045 [Clostridia bacterium]|nr:hypothetical protein [Clostridia bacterium]
MPNYSSVSPFDKAVSNFSENYNDEALIQKYHSYPLKSLILNLITLSFFIAWLVIANIYENPSYLQFLLPPVLGCLSIVLTQKICPPYYKKAIAQVMMQKYKKAPDSVKNPYYYFYRREKEVLGSVKKRPAELVIKIVGIVVKILNIICNVFCAVALSAVCLMLAGIISVFLGAAYIVFLAGRANGLAELMLRAVKASWIPVKWSFSFLFRVLSLKDFLGMGETTYSDADFSSSNSQKGFINDAFTTDPKKMGQSLSELRLDSYLSLSGLILPNGISWKGTPSVSSSGATVYVDGDLKAEPFFKTKADIQQAVDQSVQAVADHLKPQVARYFADYPNAPKVTYNIELTYTV